MVNPANNCISLLLEIKVIPSSGRQEFIFDKSRILTCYLKSAPERGKANAELIKFLAKRLKIPQATIEIVAGKCTKKKRLQITTDITYDDIVHRLGLATQQRIV